ncbi:MAG: hypothetical protein ACK56I_20605, partial [bacterium]
PGVDAPFLFHGDGGVLRLGIGGTVALDPLLGGREAEGIFDGGLGGSRREGGQPENAGRGRDRQMTNGGGAGSTMANRHDQAPSRFSDSKPHHVSRNDSMRQPHFFPRPHATRESPGAFEFAAAPPTLLSAGHRPAARARSSVG